MGHGTGPLYPVDTIGGQGLPGGATDSEFCTFRGIVKTGDEQSPFLIANEFIAGRLAMMLGLPVPPGAIVQLDDGRQAYGCLRFGAKGDAVPPIVPSIFAHDEPRLATRIVMFDCWIANPDRHEGNLAYVKGYMAPMIFDHDQALFGAFQGRQLDHLASVLDLDILNGCLAHQITSESEFSDFAFQIRALCHQSNGMLRHVCQDAQDAGVISAEEKSELVDFLEHRSSKLVEMLQKLPNLKGQAVLI
jgi:hypothetical protein